MGDVGGGDTADAPECICGDEPHVAVS